MSLLNVRPVSLQIILVAICDVKMAFSKWLMVEKCHLNCSIDWCPKFTLLSWFYLGALSSGTTVKWTLMLLCVSSCYNNKTSSFPVTGFSLMSSSKIRVKREDAPEQTLSLSLSLLSYALLWLVLLLERSGHFNAGRFLLKWALYSNLPEIDWGVEELTVAVTAV